MVSPYATRVQEYGNDWHRPWLIFGSFLAVFLGIIWLTRPTPDVSQIVCWSCGQSKFADAVNIDGLLWTADLNAGLACARKHNRRMFVAFHAIVDTNARVNEITVFRERRVQSALKPYVLVMLHTDFVPEEFYQHQPDHDTQTSDGDNNRNFEIKTFDTV